MYISSSLTDQELIRATFGTNNPLVRLLAERLEERDRTLAELTAWADRLDSAIGTVMSKRPV